MWLGGAGHKKHVRRFRRLAQQLDQLRRELAMSRKNTKRTRASAAKKERPKPSAGRSPKVAWLTTAAVAVVAVVVANAWMPEEKTAVAPPIEFTDVEEQTREFIAYNSSIKLTPGQELVKRQALSQIPAPCCSDNSAYTCCCPCNMAKTWWGLANHLIANEGYGANEVQAAVDGWIDFIGPKGFSGNACYKGGCSRPFHRNGCGGMSEKQIVF